MSKFQAGQKVRVVKGDSNGVFADGDILVVAGLPASHGCIHVESLKGNLLSSGDRDGGFFEYRFELAEEVYEGFKVGDTVEVVYNGAGVSLMDMGKRAVIVAVNPSGDDYSKLVIDGEDFTYPHYTNKRAIKCAALSVKKVNLIDFTKPVFTTEGTPVEVLTTSGRDTGYHVLAYEGKATQPSKFTAEGKSRTGEARRNLTNEVPKVEQEVTVYVNVYKKNGTLSGGGVYETRAEADRNAHLGLIVGCQKQTIKLVEGQFDA